jgi:gliding motility-associated-like protein
LQFCFFTSVFSSENPKREQLLSFVENKGQIISKINNQTILFKAELNGAEVYITSKGLSYFLINPIKTKTSSKKDSIHYEYSHFDIELKNANLSKEHIIKENQTEEEYNFFYGHCPKGIMGVKAYKKIIFKDVYPNIDWIIYNFENQGLKYDFVIKPGGDAKNISLIYKSLNPISINNKDLKLSLPCGVFNEKQPISYIESTKENIFSEFVINEQIKKHIADTDFYETEIEFNISSFDNTKTLILDPLQLWWGTYFGGTMRTDGVAISTDKLGNVIVLGNTDAKDLPIQNYGTLAYFQGTFAGANNSGGFGDAYILKFNNNGKLLWSTYFGGSALEYGRSLKCDSLGNVFVTGTTTSGDFPLKNAGGGSYYQYNRDSSVWVNKIFISKFSSSGQYLWGTFYGGEGYDTSPSITVDNQQNVFVAGITTSTTLPLLNPGNSAFFQGTYGGPGNSLSDAFIAKFSNSGILRLSTYFGGNSIDEIKSIASDNMGNTYFCGNSRSPNLYLTNPGSGAYFQSSLSQAPSNSTGFILKLNSNCQAVWSTFIGGCCDDRITSVACDKSGNVVLVGYSNSSDFPTINPGGGAFFMATNQYASNVICKFNLQSQMIWSTYFGSWSGGDPIFLNIGICDEIYITTRTGPVNTGTINQFVNPGNGAYYQSTPGYVPNASQYDILLMAFSKNGALRWGTYFGGSGEETSMLLTTDNFGNIFYTGQQGSVYYFTQSALQTYSTNCLVNPGNGAYFQSSPSYTVLNNILMTGLPYSVIGKFTSPKVTSTFTTSGCGSTNSASIIPNGFGPFAYIWSNGVQTNTIVAPKGTYSYTLTDNFFGCTSEKTIYLGDPTLNISISSINNSICKGDSTNIIATGANYFSWSPSLGLNLSSSTSVYASPSVTTNYTITGYNSPTCFSDTIIQLKIIPLPNLKVIGKDSVCSGTTLKLNVIGASNYTWLPINAFKSTNNSSVTLIPFQNETLTIVGIDSSNCKNQKVFNLNVFQLPKLSIVGKSKLCKGANDTLTASGADSLMWIVSNEITKLDNTRIIVKPLANTTYTLNGVNANICKDSATFFVQVNNPPALSINPIDSVCSETSFTLQANGQGNFNWFSNTSLSCAGCQIFESKINNNTMFFVSLTDANSCVNRDSINVFLSTDCEFQLLIPNIFTPNNDGINDLFKLTGKKISNLKCIILNRWEKQLFSFDNLDQGWDGTISGTKCADGVYFYVITGVNKKNKAFNYKGPLQLSR